jgi:hypothetical protein
VGGFVHPPLSISLHQSGVYGQQGSHLTSLLQLSFEVGVLLPTNSGIKINLKGANFMEHNQNGVLALIVLFLGLVFFVSGMVYHLWGSY